MQRDEKSLLDILNSARLALDYLSDQDQEAFLQNVQLQDAVIRKSSVKQHGASLTPSDKNGHVCLGSK
ncbi:MAG: hypothetical protein ACFLMY_04645 [Candidatus Brachytrichaceae bacterium NZ_4S206]|jgi:hypothetical protein